MPTVKKNLKTERLELRVSKQAKDRLAAAAELSGKTLTDVVATAVDLYLDKLYTERFNLPALTPKAQEQVVQALLSIPEPNPAVVAALKEYKKTLEQV